MKNDKVRDIALDLLRKVLLYEGEFRDDMTFAELDVWPADLLDLNFRLGQEFGKELATQHLIDKIKRTQDKPFDWINVGNYLHWVQDRLQALHIPVAA